MTETARPTTGGAGGFRPRLWRLELSTGTFPPGHFSPVFIYRAQGPRLDKPPIPPGIADLLAPFWVWLISFIGAAVGWLEDFKPEDDWRTKCLKAATRASSSALAAVLTYHMLLAMEVGEKWHVVLVGISGHLGVEALKWLGDFWKVRMGK